MGAACSQPLCFVCLLFLRCSKGGTRCRLCEENWTFPEIQFSMTKLTYTAWIHFLRVAEDWIWSESKPWGSPVTDSTNDFKLMHFIHEFEDNDDDSDCGDDYEDDCGGCGDAGSWRPSRRPISRSTTSFPPTAILFLLLRVSVMTMITMMTMMAIMTMKMII